MLPVPADACPTDSNLFIPGECDVSSGSKDVEDVDTVKCREKESSPSSKDTSNLTFSSGKQDDVDNNYNVLNLTSSFGLQTTIPMELLAQLASPSSVTVVNGQRFGSKKGNGEKKQRKSLKFKPSNVWNHFLRLSDGNVQCVHCAKILKRKDSSTKTMWGHLRAIHFKGRDWTVLQQQAARDRNRHLADPIELLGLDETDPGTVTARSTQSWLEQQVGIGSDPPNQQLYGNVDGLVDTLSTDLHSFSSLGTPAQPYVKRNRSVLIVPNNCTTNLKNCDQNAANESASASCSVALNGIRAALVQSQGSNEEKPVNFLSTIPHTSEVINITAGYNGEDERQMIECSKKLEENGDADYSADYGSSLALNNSGSPFCQSQNHSGSENSGASSHSSLPLVSDIFSIFDGELMVMFMRVASDLDCTLSFKCCNGQPQLCFMSNRIVADNSKSSKVCILEMDSEVRISVRNDEMEIDNEHWKKTDKAQFMWAVRGKCQKVLT